MGQHRNAAGVLDRAQHAERILIRGDLDDAVFAFGQKQLVIQRGVDPVRFAALHERVHDMRDVKIGGAGGAAFDHVRRDRIFLGRFDHHFLRGALGSQRVFMAQALEPVRKIGKITQNMYDFAGRRVNGRQLNAGDHADPVAFADDLGTHGAGLTVSIRDGDGFHAFVLRERDDVFNTHTAVG